MIMTSGWGVHPATHTAAPAIIATTAAMPLSRQQQRQLARLATALHQELATSAELVAAQEAYAAALARPSARDRGILALQWLGAVTQWLGLLALVVAGIVALTVGIQPLLGWVAAQQPLLVAWGAATFLLVRCRRIASTGAQQLYRQLQCRGLAGGNFEQLRHTAALIEQLKGPQPPIDAVIAVIRSGTGGLPSTSEWLWDLYCLRDALSNR